MIQEFFSKCLIVEQVNYLPESSDSILLNFEKELTDAGFTITHQSDRITMLTPPEKYSGNATYIFISINGHEIYSNVLSSKILPG